MMTRAEEVYEQLNEANPSIEPLVEALENELEFVFEDFYDRFDELFLDNGIAVNTYEGLTDEDENYVMDWQSEILNQAITRLHKRLADRFQEKTGND